MPEPRPAETDAPPPPEALPGPEQARAALALIDAVNATIPDAGCKGLCGQEECLHVVNFTPAERTRLPVDYPEWTHETRDDPCPLFDGHRCTAYERRPSICRLYGVVDDPHLRCEHGCEPVDGQWLTAPDTLAVLQGVRLLGEGGLDLITDPAGLVERLRTAFAHPTLAAPIGRINDHTPDDLDVWMIHAATMDAAKGMDPKTAAVKMERRADRVARHRRNHPALDQALLVSAMQAAFGGGVDADDPEELAQMFGQVVDENMPGPGRARPPTPRRGKRTKQTRGRRG
jgi:uncharacterized protein